MNTGIVSGNLQNTPSASSIKTRSKFDLSRHNLGTFRFGENAPFFVMECVPKDKVTLSSKHDVRTYTLKAPLMQDVKMSKDSFYVPMEAILPFNWEKVYTNPVIGDDVSPDVGTSVSNMVSRLVASFKSCSSKIKTGISGNWTNIQILRAEFCCLIAGEMFFSKGSLASSLGYRFSDCWEILSGSGAFKYDYDKYFELCIANFLAMVSNIQFTYRGKTYYYDETGSYGAYNTLTLRELLEILRDDVRGISFDACTMKAGHAKPDFMNLVVTTCPNKFDDIPSASGSTPNIPVDIARLWAYQLINAHYYSNDHVDYVYSAELFRMNVSSVVSNADNLYDFTYNGVSTQYDYLSAFYFENLIPASGSDLVSSSGATLDLVYLQLLMSFRHSLRYMDYFVGSRTTPLAIGNVNAPVSGGNVSAIDTTRSIQMQRFLNAVNRSGRKFSNYIKEMFDVTPAVDYHNPIYLGHTADTIYGVETENTGAAMMTDDMTIRTNLRSNSERYIFDFFADRPCIVMGILSFDVARIYRSAMERQLFHKDRFDMFNPFMQYLGDQRVYEAEIKPRDAGSTELLNTFGYQNRHAEYKQGINSCFGGFATDALKNWCFVAEAFEPNYGVTISPSFIRSKTYEFDRFYQSLTGYSLGNYFHFIVSNYNKVSAVRPMSYNPNIL